VANCAVADKEATKLTFDHQCFLMDYADILAGLNVGCAYKNFHAISVGTGDDTAHDIIASFAKRKGLEKIIKLKPADHGILQPMVRLFRVFPKTEGGRDAGIENEFIFSAHVDPNNVAAITAAQGSLSRLGGVGLKKFEWEFAGTNPAEADKIIGVKMTLHFQTMGDLTKNWSTDAATDTGWAKGGTSGDTEPSFMELILLPPAKHGTSGVCNRPNKNGYNPDYYTIKAVVGWAMPTSAEDIDPVLMRELKSTQLTMYLNLITHELKVNDDGSLDVDVEYVGAMEAALDSKDADVLFPSSWQGAGEGAVVSGGFMGFGEDDRTITDVDAEAEALEAALASNEDQTECAATADGDSTDELDELASEREGMEDRLDELQELQKQLNDENRSKAYQAFTQAISGKIRHLDLDNGFLEHWQENEDNKRPALTGDDSGGVVTITIGDDSWFNNPEDVAENADETDVKDDDVYFVFFGDIIDVACLSFSPQNVQSPKSPVKNMKVVLGPMKYINMREPYDDKGNLKLNMISLADIPISYTMFLKFWNDKVVAPERDSYSVRAFIQDVLTNLVAPALQPGCFPNGPTQNTTVSKAAFTVSSPGGAVDVIGQCPTVEGRTSMPALKEHMRGTGAKAGAAGDESGFQYVLFYMNAAKLGNGKPDEDAKNGIYHYAIGEDRGLIKKIEFKKNDVQGMKEARQDTSGAMSQLREMYNADVKMVGNNIYIPGMTLFLWPPPGLGNPANKGSAANLLGIGGYFNVIKVRSSISRGGTYSTDLECIFVAASKDSLEGESFDCPPENIADVPVNDAPFSMDADDVWDAVFGEPDWEDPDAKTITQDDVEGDSTCEGEPSPEPWFDWLD
jgi:hypothetical protein